MTLTYCSTKWLDMLQLQGGSLFASKDGHFTLHHMQPILHYRRASDIWDDNHLGEEEAAEEEGRGQEKTEEGRTRGD